MNSAESVFREAVAKAMTLSDVGEMAAALREESQIYFDRLRHEKITAWLAANVSDAVLKYAEERIDELVGYSVIKAELVALCAQQCSPSGVDETHIIEDAWEVRYCSLRE